MTGRTYLRRDVTLKPERKPKADAIDEVTAGPAPGRRQIFGKKVLQIYEPQPDPRLVALYGEHGAFVPVHDHSPRWLRNRLAGMATMATAIRVPIARTTATLKHR